MNRRSKSRAYLITLSEVVVEDAMLLGETIKEVEGVLGKLPVVALKLIHYGVLKVQATPLEARRLRSKKGVEGVERDKERRV